MIWNPFKAAPKSFLGVDIGTSSIKIVELSRSGKRKKLDNYGEMQATSLYEKPFRTFEKSTLTVSTQDVIRAIRGIIKEAKMQSRRAYFSIPDFSSFFTTLDLPPMTEEELPRAVEYQARQHIPLPLSEVTLDWQIIEEGKVLLVAVPNEVIHQYQEIAKEATLELISLEAEVFSLARALVGEKEFPVVLIDIGARSTTINIIEKGILKISHSFDTAGNDLTNVIAKGFNLDYKNAEEIKRKQGLNPEEGSPRESLLPLVDLILTEIKKIIQSYFQSDKKEVQKIILAGGTARLPGLADYFSKNLGKSVVIANPFLDLYYPPILEELLKEMGPSYSIAVGAALYGLQ
jgi:type IV pilus assembly protein PilM